MPTAPAVAGSGALCGAGTFLASRGQVSENGVRSFHLSGTDQNAAIHLYTHERACPEARSARGRGCPMTRGRGSARGLVQCRRGRTAEQREPVVDPLSGQALVSAGPLVPSPAPRAQIEPGTEQVEKALSGAGAAPPRRPRAAMRSPRQVGLAVPRRRRADDETAHDAGRAQDACAAPGPSTSTGTPSSPPAPTTARPTPRAGATHSFAPAPTPAAGCAGTSRASRTPPLRATRYAAPPAQSTPILPIPGGGACKPVVPGAAAAWASCAIRARQGEDHFWPRVPGRLRGGHVPCEPWAGLGEWSPVLPYIPLRNLEESPPTSGEEDSIVAKTRPAPPARLMPHRTRLGISVPPRLGLPSRLPCPRGVTRRWCRG